MWDPRSVAGLFFCLPPRSGGPTSHAGGRSRSTRPSARLAPPQPPPLAPAKPGARFSCPPPPAQGRRLHTSGAPALRSPRRTRGAIHRRPGFPHPVSQPSSRNSKLQAARATRKASGCPFFHFAAAALGAWGLVSFFTPMSASTKTRLPFFRDPRISTCTNTTSRSGPFKGAPCAFRVSSSL